VPNDVALLESLNDVSMWRNPGHVTTRGAELYSLWLARRLDELQVLKK
jgi:hypothetical protein